MAGLNVNKESTFYIIQSTIFPGFGLIQSYLQTTHKQGVSIGSTLAFHAKGWQFKSWHWTNIILAKKGLHVILEFFELFY